MAAAALSWRRNHPEQRETPSAATVGASHTLINVLEKKRARAAQPTS